MGEILAGKRDHGLRRLLSDPKASYVGRKRPMGHGAMRLLVACTDLAQVMLVGVLLSMPLLPHAVLRALGLSATAACLSLLVRRGLRPTTSLQPTPPARDARRAALAVGLAWLAMLAPVCALSDGTEVGAVTQWGLCSAAMSACVAFLIRMSVVSRSAQRSSTVNIAVVGSQPEVGLLTSVLSKQDNHRVLAQLSPASPSDMTRLEELASSGHVDKIVLAGIETTEAERICLAVGDSHAHICLGFDTLTYLSLNASAPKSLPPPLLPLMASPSEDWRSVVKRVSDIAIVLAFAPIVAPALLLAAVAIRIESPGPILFRQWRFGLGSRPTQVLKFRTMYHDRGDVTGESRTLARDPRVTRVGRILRRTSIDEMPQFFNVLRGDMSLVGPRPHATHMKVEGNYYFEAVEGYRMRHRVKPGITGWAQVNGSRGEVDTIDKARDRVEKDLWYVRNWSLFLDLKILAMTALGGFMTRGAD